MSETNTAIVETEASFLASLGIDSLELEPKKQYSSASLDVVERGMAYIDANIALLLEAGYDIHASYGTDAPAWKPWDTEPGAKLLEVDCFKGDEHSDGSPRGAYFIIHASGRYDWGCQHHHEAAKARGEKLDWYGAKEEIHDILGYWPEWGDVEDIPEDERWKDGELYAGGKLLTAPTRDVMSAAGGGESIPPAMPSEEQPAAPSTPSAEEPDTSEALPDYKSMSEEQVQAELEKTKKKAATQKAESGADTATSEPMAWAGPVPVDEPLLPVPPFKLEYLPKAFRPWAKDVAERMCVPLDFVGISMICCLAGATNRRVFVYPKANDETWKEALNLGGFVVTESGGMKTPTWKAVMNTLTGVEIRMREEHAQEMKVYKDRMAAYKLAVTERKARLKGKKTGDVEEDSNRVPNEPTEPPPGRRLIINDATPEKMHTMMFQNPEGLLLYRDEISGLMAQMDKPGREAEREMFLVAMNGNDPYSLDRMGRDDVFATMCLSVFGVLQPKVARDLVSDERNTSDGTIARIGLLIWPDEIPAEKCKPIDRAADEKAKATFEQAIEAIVWKKAESIKAKFTPQAQPAFTAWLENQFQIERGFKGPIRSHVSKYKGLLPRLAALYQLADVAAESPKGLGGVDLSGFLPVDDEHLRCVTRFLEDYLKPHARRAYACLRTPFQRSLSSLAERLAAGDLEDGFTARIVYEKGWAGLTKPDEAKDTITSLCEKHWLRPIFKGNAGRGRPSGKYEINPILKSGNKTASRAEQPAAQ